MTSLTERAMLVSLSISQWTARKHDKRASDKVATDNDAGPDAGRYNKSLIAKEALKEVASIAHEARAHHYEDTLPWTDDGFRILPAPNYWAYVEAQRRFKSEFELAVARFCASYDGYVQEARLRLGRLFNAGDYPCRAEIAAKFSFATGVMPLPDAGDFRVALGDLEEARIRADIERRMTEASEAAMRDLWRRVYEAVSHMAKRLELYEVDPRSGRVQHPFRDTLVDNLRRLAELLPRLNISGDPALDAMRERLVQSLCRHDAQELREDRRLREGVAREAEQILLDMAGYIGPSPRVAAAE